MKQAKKHSEDSGLRMVPRDVHQAPSQPRRRPRTEAKPPGIVTQIRIAFRAKNRLASVAGLLLGGVIPVMTYFVAHFELTSWTSVMGALVSGGLLFSATTVWQWGRAGFACPWKATGFAVLIEGVMIVSHQAWLSQVALCYLIAINGIATGVRFSQQK